MGLGHRFEQRFNTPAKPDPLPLARDADLETTRCPACSVGIRPGALLCVNCGARLGRIETTAPPGMATRAPCAACGYDLSGVIATMCPECGRPAPFAPAPLDALTEDEERTARQMFWDSCRPAIWAAGLGLVLLLGLAGAWYGLRGVQFWLAAVVPTWVVASVGYVVIGSILRFIDTTLPIALLQVLGVVMLGLAVTQLVFPYNAGQLSGGLWGVIVIAAVVLGATMKIMDDDDRVDSFLASIPLAIACMAVPLALLLVVR